VDVEDDAWLVFKELQMDYWQQTYAVVVVLEHERARILNARRQG